MTKDAWIQKAKALLFDVNAVSAIHSLRTEAGALIEEGGGYDYRTESSKTPLRWSRQGDEEEPEENPSRPLIDPVNPGSFHLWEKVGIGTGNTSICGRCKKVSVCGIGREGECPGESETPQPNKYQGQRKGHPDGDFSYLCGSHYCRCCQ